MIRGLRFAFAAFALAAVSSGSDANRSPDSGITISLRKVSTLPPGTDVCLGVCRIGSYANVTVWPDGDVLLIGGEHFQVSKEEAAHFRQILAPLLPANIHSDAEAAEVVQKICPVQIQWPADKNGARPVTCGYYSVGGIPNRVFETIVNAFHAVHLNKNGYRYP